MPEYTMKGVVTTVNGVEPDSTGNVIVSGVDNATIVAIIDAIRGANDGLAPLDSDGKIPSQYIKNLFLFNFSEADSEAEMLALTAEQGDFCIRTDVGKTFFLAESDPTVLSNWKEIIFTITASGVQATDPTSEDAFTDVQTVLNHLNQSIHNLVSGGKDLIVYPNPYGSANTIGSTLSEVIDRTSDNEADLAQFISDVGVTYYTKIDSDARYRGINDPFEALETGTSSITNAGWLTNTQNVQAYFASIVGKIDTMDTTIAGKANSVHTHTTSQISNLSSYNSFTDYYTKTSIDNIIGTHTHAATQISHDNSFTGYGNTVQSALVDIKSSFNSIYAGDLTANNITYLAGQTLAQKIGLMDTATSTAQSTANTANTNAQTALNNIGTMANLTTTVTTSLVNAVNSVKSEINTLNTGVGTVGSLNTTATNVVGAVNELKGRIDTAESNITTNSNNISTNTTNIATNTAAIGTLSSLNTTAKSNLVAAINEVRTTANNAYAPTNKVPLLDVYGAGSILSPTGQTSTTTASYSAALWNFTRTSSDYQLYGLSADQSATGTFSAIGGSVIAEVRASDTLTVLASSAPVTIAAGTNIFIFNEPITLLSGVTYCIGFRNATLTSTLPMNCRISQQVTAYAGFNTITQKIAFTYSTGVGSGGNAAYPNFSLIGTNLVSSKGINSKIAPSDILGTNSNDGFTLRFNRTTNTYVSSPLRFDDLAGPMTTQFISTLATGTAPFSVVSTTAVNNLNADMVDGLHGSSFAQLAQSNVFTVANQFFSANNARIILNRPASQTGQYTAIRFDDNNTNKAHIGYDYTNSLIVFQDGQATPANIMTLTPSDKSANFYGKLQVNGSNGNFYVDTTGNDVYFTRTGVNSIRTSGSGSSLNFVVNGNTPLTFNSDGTITATGNLTATGTFTVSRTNAKVLINRASGSVIQYTGVQITDNNTDVAYLVYDHTAGSIVISGAAPGTPIVTYTVSTKASTFAGQIVSSVVQGIAPFVVTSTTMVSNLNVERLNGQTGSYYNIQDIEDGIEGINTDVTLFRTLISRAQTITAVGGLTSLAQATSFKISVQKNGTEVASVTFAAGATTTSSPTGFPVSFAVNDRLKIATIGMDGSTIRDLDYYVQRNQQ